jgi:Hemerythrin HHE cation binding domain
VSLPGAPPATIAALRADHPEALSVAAELASACPPDVEHVRAGCLPFVDDFLWEHCTTEEIALLPALDRDPAGRDLAHRERDAHTALRAAAAAARGASDAEAAAALRALGAALRDHVVREDAELYPCFEPVPDAERAWTP